jgi:hypothetical protein
MTTSEPVRVPVYVGRYGQPTFREYKRRLGTVVAPAGCSVHDKRLLRSSRTRWLTAYDAVAAARQRSHGLLWEPAPRSTRTLTNGG